MAEQELSEEAAPRRGFRWSHLVLGVLLVALVGGAFWLKSTRTPVTRSTAPATSPAATPGESTQALLARGIREHNAGANDAAMELYHRVLQREPGHAQAHYNLGQIYNTRGEYAKAQWEYEATLKAEPESVNAFRYYRSPGETGAHTAHLWSATGQLITSTNFGTPGMHQQTDRLLTEYILPAAGD